MAEKTNFDAFHFPCEACKNFECRDDWERRDNTCPVSLQEARPECPPWKWWWFKKSDPHIPCEVHGHPVVPKCPDPYRIGGKLRIWTGTTLGSLAMRETPEWPDAGRPAYLNALVADGVNAERMASSVAPGDPLDPLTYYKFGTDQYWSVIDWRLGQYLERDLTPILTVLPYKGELTDDDIRELIRRTRRFQPIYECANEPGDNWTQERVLRILQAEGVPLDHIMVAFVDSSDWFEMMKTVADLDGQGEIIKIKCLLSAHQFGSMETIRDTFGAGGNADKILSWGNFVASNDGPDKLLKTTGLNFRYLAERGADARRETPEKMREVAAYFIDRERGGYEDLSASGYQRPTTIGPDGGPVSWPNMDDAIELGRAERLAMRAK